MAKYHMYKREREITEASEVESILKKGKYATISLCRNNEPYIVTLSYGYDAEKRALYFHAATKGLKLEFIRENPAACGTVVEDLGYVLGHCSHKYRSVVFWGRMSRVEDLNEKKRGIDVLLNHLETDPEPIRQRNLKDDRDFEKAAILRLDIDEISGKKGQ